MRALLGLSPLLSCVSVCASIRICSLSSPFRSQLSHCPTDRAHEQLRSALATLARSSHAHELPRSQTTLHGGAVCGLLLAAVTLLTLYDLRERRLLSEVFDVEMMAEEEVSTKVRTEAVLLHAPSYPLAHSPSCSVVCR